MMYTLLQSTRPDPFISTTRIILPLVRPPLTIYRRRATPLPVWLHRNQYLSSVRAAFEGRSMASSPRETLSRGAIVDVTVGGDCLLPHQAASLDGPRNSAPCTLCVCSLCDDAKPSWSHDASEPLPVSNLHDALRALPHGWTGNGLRRAIEAARARAGGRGG